MTPEQRCERIAYDLDQLAADFLANGRRGIACRVLEMCCAVVGDKCFSSDESPLAAAQEIAAELKGGAA